MHEENGDSAHPPPIPNVSAKIFADIVPSFKRGEIPAQSTLANPDMARILETQSVIEQTGKVTSNAVVEMVPVLQYIYGQLEQIRKKINEDSEDKKKLNRYERIFDRLIMTAVGAGGVKLLEWLSHLST